MNDQKLSNRGKIVRPSLKHNNATKSLTKASKVCTHIPTVRCHEEIMSTSSHTMGPCIGESVKFIDKSEDHNKVKKRGKLRQEYNIRFGCSKSKDVRESSSAPLETAKLLFSKTKSKSTPHVQKPNLDDSIDFIPVKLSSNNDHKHIDKEKCSKSHRARPTWDELLKSESQNSSIKNKDNILNSGRNIETNFQTVESVINTPKQISRPNSVLSGRQDEDVNAFHRFLNFPKSYDQQTDPVYTSDPLKTLDFLIKQLREKISKQQENDYMGKIILDMENALLKISAEKTSYNVVNAFSNAATKSMPSSSTETKSKNSHLNVAQLQKGLEESCLFLQSLCIRQRERCNNHIREKEQLTLQLAESRRLLAIATSREKDYEITIGELRLKIQEISARKDQRSQEVQELMNIVAKLRDENKVFNIKLEELTTEKENLLSKLSRKDLEIERLKVLLEVKENTSPALICKKNGEYKEHIKHKMSLDIPGEDKDNTLLSVSTAMSCNKDKPGLVCSSEASSSPSRHSPSPYNSWQNISSICQQPSAGADLKKQHIFGIFQNLQNKVFNARSPQLDSEIPFSSNSFSSDTEDRFVNSEFKFSDCESGTLSS